MKIVRVILLVLSLWENSHAQCNLNCSIQMTDAAHQLPMAYVIAELKNDQTNEILHRGITDSLGQLTWNKVCAGSYVISVHRVGIDSQTMGFKLVADTVLEMHVSTNSHMLQQIEIQSERGFRDSDIAQTIAPENIQYDRGKSIADMLANATGVRVLRNGSNIAKPMIQGLYGNRLLLFYQGVRHEAQQWGSEHAPEIDPYSATKGIVYKGPLALRFGHDAIGGMVCIENEDIPQTTGFQQHLILGTATNGRMGAASGSISWRPKRFSALGMRAQGTWQGAGNTRTPRVYLDNTGNRNRHFSWLTQFDNSRFQSEIFYSLYAGEVGIFSGSHIGNITDLQRIIDVDSIVTSNQFSYTINRPRQHILHELVKWNISGKISAFDKWTLQFARQYNLRDEYDRFGALNDSISGLNQAELHMEITTHSGFASYLYKKEHWTFEAKWDATRQENTTSGRVFIPNFIQIETGGYAGLTYRKKRNEWIISGRFDQRKLQCFFYNSQTLEKPKHSFQGWSSALSRHQHIGKKSQLTWNIGHSWRAPHANELYSNGLHHGAATIEYGNSQLAPEQAWTTQMQFITQHDRWEWHAEVYVKRIDNFINLLTTGQYTATIRGVFPTFAFTSNDVTMRGIDAKLQFNINEHIQCGSEASILRARDIHSHDWIYRMPADQYRGFVSTQIHRHPDGVPTWIQLYFTYVNHQWRIQANRDYTATPSAYSLVQMRVRRSFQWNKLIIDAALSIDNLLNSTYRDYLDAMRYYTNAPGRNIAMQLDLHF